MLNPANERPLVIVTGSTGLIGSRLVENLSADFRVVGMDLKPPHDEQPYAQWVECDLTEPNGASQALEEIAKRAGRQVASVIHLAAYYDFTGEPSSLYEELTVEGTRRMLEALRKFSVEQFVFSSSLLVMQSAAEGKALTEDSPLDPAWDYPQSKVEAEAVIRDEHGKIPAVILRIAGVYDEEGHSIPIAQQIRRIYEKQFESYFFPGNAEHGQAFVHLEDLVMCFRRTIEARRTLEDYEVCLVAEPDVMSYNELQDQIGEALHGKEWPTYRIPKFVAKAGAWVKDKLAGDDEETFIKPWMVDLADAHYPVDISRARERLNWQPRHRLRSTLPAMLERLQRNPRGWYGENGLPVES
jgi:nucleoside-diphosphate-sugar epimerase